MVIVTYSMKNRMVYVVLFAAIVLVPEICALPVYVVPVNKGEIKKTLNLPLDESSLKKNEFTIKPRLETQIKNLLTANGYPLLQIKYRDHRDSEGKMTSIDVAVPKDIKFRLETNLGGKQETQNSYTSLIPDFDGKLSYDQLLRQLAPGRPEGQDKVYKGTDAKSNPIVKGMVVDIMELTGLTFVQVG